MIACEVCGTRNEDKLTFCRTCGHRLKAKKRAAPPTPASGLNTAQPNNAKPSNPKPSNATSPSYEKLPSKAKLPSEPGADDFDFELDDVPARHSRPSAPAFDLDSQHAEPAAPDGKVKCAQCDALSPKEYRFCISCGAVLRSPPKRPSRTQVPGKPAVRAAAQVASQPEAARSKPDLELDKPRARARLDAPSTAKTRLDKLKKPKASAVSERGTGGIACEACDGVNDEEASFCKYCGAALPKDRAAQKAAPPPRPRDMSSPLELAKVPAKDPFPLADSLVEDDGDELELDVAAPPPPPVPVRPPAKARKPVPEVEKATGKLVVIVEDGSEGRALELRGRQMDIGSVEGDIILAEDRYLSPRHARFFRQDGSWYLRDLSSVNGVYQRLRQPTPLKHGDLVLLGLEVLEFEIVDHAERGLGHAIQHGVLVFGSPAALRRARLRQRTVEGIVRDVYHLVSDETTIGRETGDIVFTSDPFMSRRHAAIQWDEETQEYVLVDLSSSNGTYLAIRDDVRLGNGDFIRLGQHLFRVDLP